jgi:cytochrome c5
MKTMFFFFFTLLIVAPLGATTNIEQLIHSEKSQTFETGEKVYKQHCMSCHAASNIMVSSPKFGDRQEWGRRLLAEGSLNQLVKNAVKGKNAMPKKGRCINCKAEQIRSGILYMMRGGGIYENQHL